MTSYTSKLDQAVTLPRVSLRRERWAWYLYDFGNSAYAAVVLLAVYSVYFKEQVVGGARGSFLWGLAVGISMLIVALVSPLLGVIADFSASKKRFLLIFTTLSCVFCALLFFAERGQVLIGMLFFILAEVGYRGAQVFYNALLPEIATPKEIGRVSGDGWAIGSAGGIVCLLVILPLIMLIKGTLVVRASLVITAAFFALFAAPIFLWLKERGRPQALPHGESHLTIGVRRLVANLREARRYPHFLRFLVAFLIYNDGIIMALDFAGILGAVLFGITQQQLIVFMILVQVTSVAGAFAFGVLAERRGCKPALVTALLAMLGAIFWLYANHSVAAFYAIGGLAGFALTGVQSVSRAMVGSFSPPGQSASFYGLFAVAGRTSSFIGPAFYGLVASQAARWFQVRGLASLAAEQQGQRLAVLSIAVFLLVGLGLLLAVNERRGQQDALAGAAEAD